MPTIWRYLIGQFLRYTALATAAIIAILLTTRFKEIAHFATLGPQIESVVWFTLYQIPYVFPIAFPIGALIAAMILAQRLSDTSELTALRASGFSVRDLFAPLLIAAAFLALLNFYVVSEMATKSHLATTLMKNELRAINPLHLLGNNRLLHLKGLFYEPLGATKSGEFAEDVLIAMPAADEHYLTLLMAKKLSTDNSQLKGEELTLITPFQSDQLGFDNLLTENTASALTYFSGLAGFTEKGLWTFSQDHLSMSFLFKTYLQQQKSAYSAEDPSEKKEWRKSANRTLADIERRFSIGLAVLTFTFTGLAFGIHIGRKKTIANIIYVVILAAFFIITFFAAKSVSHTIESASILNFFPHLLMIGLAIFMLHRVNKGIES